MREAALLVHRTRPGALVVSLRGANPFGRMLLHALRRDRRVRRVGRFGEPGGWRVAPPAFFMPSSYFLEDLSGCVGPAEGRCAGRRRWAEPRLPRPALRLLAPGLHGRARLHVPGHARRSDGVRGAVAPGERDAPRRRGPQGLDSRLRAARTRVRTVASQLREDDPAAADRMEALAHEVLDGLGALDRSLPGAAAARARSSTRSSTSPAPPKTAREVTGLNPDAVRCELAAFDAGRVVRSRVARAVVAAMYRERGLAAARARGVVLEHTPIDRLASHAAARAARPGDDVALLVGPEGFAYEPLFRDAGLPTVGVNVPESEPGGPRTVHTPPGEDLGALEGWRVLLVEDDVRTGATLRAVLGALPVRPASVGLYLDSSAGLQKLTAVPPEVSEVHVSAGEHDEAVDEFLWFLEERDMGAFLWDVPRSDQIPEEA